MKWKAIVLHERDDVATALTDLKAGEHVTVVMAGRPLDVTLAEDIAFCHKFALHNIARGEQILKYGMPILKALQDIAVGQWVHTHNGRSDRWGPGNQDVGVITGALDHLGKEKP